MKLSGIVKDMNPTATAIFQFLQQHGARQANRLLARACVGCGVQSEVIICDTCIQTLKKPEHRCRQCGIALPAETVSQRCQACIQSPPRYQCLDYLANYQGLIADCVVSAKIGRQITAIEAIKWLTVKYFSAIEDNHYQGYALLPMPIPQFRLMQRGFNLPRMMAVQIATITGLPVMPSHVVLLPRQTQKQARLSKKQRAKRRDNIIVREKMPKKILIIDDVVTTGRTVRNMAKVLSDNHVESIAVWALARAQWD